jgi:hypothetical protein
MSLVEGPVIDLEDRTDGSIGGTSDHTSGHGQAPKPRSGSVEPWCSVAGEDLVSDNGSNVEIAKEGGHLLMTDRSSRSPDESCLLGVPEDGANPLRPPSRVVQPSGR